MKTERGETGIKAPIIGDTVLEQFKDSFEKKHCSEKGEIPGIKMWPAAAIEEAYRKAAEAIGGKDEAQAMKAFYMDMVHFLRTGTYIDSDPGEEEYILGLLEDGAWK